MKDQFKTIWIIPFILVVCMVAVLSMRLLSDPDIGSHLKAGKWIVENKTVPSRDTFTYTVNSHDYTDMNWLFQVIVFSLFSIAGYKGLSIFVMGSVLVLLFLLLIRNKRKKIPVYISGFLVMTGFLVMETRISLRPELFTFLFLTLSLMILDSYYNHRKNLLFLLPVIMLFWCNIHGLFILGFALSGSYFLGMIFRDKKADKSLFLWMVVSALACLINPYFLKGITFPLELFTRFDTGNIFHTHIKELKSFYDLDRLFMKDILFIIFFVSAFLGVILSWRKRAVHEFLLLIIFAYLALVSVRNVALFAVVGMPILSISLADISAAIHERSGHPWFPRFRRVVRIPALLLMIILPLGLISMLVTGAYYTTNTEYTKTGLGLDSRQLPDKAADFLLQNRLEGRFINGISLGGWLSWRLPQQVFIDGRLEVIREDLYQELTESWKSGLSDLAVKYQADMIIYNYVKYYPWTVQLSGMPGWRLIYIDGLSAIFARNGYSSGIPEVNTASLLTAYNIPGAIGDSGEMRILTTKQPSPWRTFLEGFWKKVDYRDDDLLNMGSFFLQVKNYPVAEKLLLANIQRTEGRNRFIYYALADIYSASGNLEKAAVCYKEILGFEPGNVAARSALELLGKGRLKTGSSAGGESNDMVAKENYNQANEQYRNGKISEAIRLYDEAIRLSPGYFKAYNNRAIVKAAALKNYKDAITDFSEAIRINPEYADAYLGRGTSKLELNDLDGACADWQKSASLGNKQAVMLIQHYCPGKKL